MAKFEIGGDVGKVQNAEGDGNTVSSREEGSNNTTETPRDDGESKGLLYTAYTVITVIVGAAGWYVAHRDSMLAVLRAVGITGG